MMRMIGAVLALMLGCTGGGSNNTSSTTGGTTGGGTTGGGGGGTISVTLHDPSSVLAVTTQGMLPDPLFTPPQGDPWLKAATMPKSFDDDAENVAMGDVTHGHLDVTGDATSFTLSARLDASSTVAGANNGCGGSATFHNPTICFTPAAAAPTAVEFRFDCDGTFTASGSAGGGIHASAGNTVFYCQGSSDMGWMMKSGSVMVTVPDGNGRFCLADADMIDLVIAVATVGTGLTGAATTNGTIKVTAIPH
jgi:hypothetical protein